jgi:hypothetical protein
MYTKQGLAKGKVYIGFYNFICSFQNCDWILIPALWYQASCNIKLHTKLSLKRLL